MIDQLIEMYDKGSITGYQVMMDCLRKLDPGNPSIVLSGLPREILDEILEYARRYDPCPPHSKTLIPPAEGQVRAAERWIFARDARRSNPAHR